MGLSTLGMLRKDKESYVQIIDTKTDAVSFYKQKDSIAILESNKEDKTKAVFYIDNFSYVYHNDNRVGKFNLNTEKNYVWDFSSDNGLVNISTNFRELIKAEKFVINTLLDPEILMQLTSVNNKLKI